MFKTTLELMSVLIGCKSENNYEGIDTDTTVVPNPAELVNKTCTPPNIDFVIPQLPPDATLIEKLILANIRLNIAKFFENYNEAKNQANQANQQTVFTTYDHNSYPDSDEEAGAMALYGANMQNQFEEYLIDGILYSNSFLISWEAYGAYSFAYLPNNTPAFECGAYTDSITGEQGLMYAYRKSNEGTISFQMNIDGDPDKLKVAMMKEIDGVRTPNKHEYEFEGTTYAIVPLNRGIKDQAEAILDGSILLSTNSLSDVEVENPPSWLDSTRIMYGLYI